MRVLVVLLVGPICPLLACPCSTVCGGLAAIAAAWAVGFTCGLAAMRQGRRLPGPRKCCSAAGLQRVESSY